MVNQLKATFEQNAVSILSHMYPLPDMKKTKLFVWLRDTFPVFFQIGLFRSPLTLVGLTEIRWGAI